MIDSDIVNGVKKNFKVVLNSWWSIPLVQRDDLREWIQMVSVKYIAFLDVEQFDVFIFDVL